MPPYLPLIADYHLPYLFSFGCQIAGYECVVTTKKSDRCGFACIYLQVLASILSNIILLVNAFLAITYIVCYDKRIKKEEVYYMATVSLTIRIDENDKKVIEELAKKDDRSISYIVNQSIKEFIKKSSSNGQTLEKAK